MASSSGELGAHSPAENSALPYERTRMDQAPSPLRWSGSFAVQSSNATKSHQLEGDKITLPQSALEQLLAAAPSHPFSANSFTAHDRSNTYALPNTSTLYRETSQQLPNPLTFRLVNPLNNNVVYAGIREFSAPEGIMMLSPFLMDALGVNPHQTASTTGLDADSPSEFTSEDEGKSISITAHAANIPKGTFVRLRPLEAGYNPDDWKSLLERQLRQSFTTLTKDAVLSVRGVKGESFSFLVDKILPEGDSICVIDTDLEVDIEALNEEQARETLRQIVSREQGSAGDKSSKGGTLDIWKAVDGQVVPGEYVDYTLPSWDRSQRLEIVLSGLQDEDSVDLFVTPKSSQQRALPREAAHVFGNFSSAENGVKSIAVVPTNVELEDAELIAISVHGYRHEDYKLVAPSVYSLRARMSPIDESTASVINGESDRVEAAGEEEQCQNCLQFIPKRTMVLHESFCRRNNIVCPMCKSVFKKSSPEWESHWHCSQDTAHGNDAFSQTKHNDIFHTERHCPTCDFTTNSAPDLARHQTSTCPGKLILCRFCHLEVPQEGDPFNPSPEVVLSGMTAHELADGARTTECHLCDKIVRLRDMDMHLRNHDLDKVSRAKPAVCRNANCARTLHGVGPKGQINRGTAQGQGPGNALGLCSLCFGPLYVSMHDPEGKALRRRIERRYLSQLMTGCGKPHCRNEWCKTGRANRRLEAKGSSAAAALKEVKPLLEIISTEDRAMYFCVDETSQQRRHVAEMVAAENVWDWEWCVAAAEAERGDVVKMREWLQAWAPTKI